MKGALVGKPAGLFTSTACQGGGQETTLMTSVTQLAHHGMVYVPIGYSCPLLNDNSEVCVCMCTFMFMCMFCASTRFIHTPCNGACAYFYTLLRPCGSTIPKCVSVYAHLCVYICAPCFHLYCLCSYIRHGMVHVPILILYYAPVPTLILYYAPVAAQF